jgi:hypothetical protein
VYLWGYWGVFGINALEYIGLADVLKFSAYPMASAIVFFSIGVLSASIGTGKSNAGAAVSRWHWVTTWSDRLFVAVMLAIFGSAAYAQPSVLWLALVPVTGVPVALAIRRHHLFQEVIANDRVRSTLAFLIGALPAFAFATGRINADAVLEGRTYWYVAAVDEGLALSNPNDPAHRVKLLGRLDGYLFFLLPDAQTVRIARNEDIKGLEIRREKKKSP